MRMSKGSVKVELEDIEEWRDYAARKGFKRLSDLTRFALFQYRAKYPLKDSKTVRFSSPQREKK